MHRKWIQAVFQLDSPNVAGRMTGLGCVGREAGVSGLQVGGGTSGPSHSPMECDPMEEGCTAVGRSWLVGAAGRLAAGVTAPGANLFFACAGNFCCVFLHRGVALMTMILPFSFRSPQW